MNRPNDRTPEARADRSSYRDDDADLYGFFPHRGPEAGPQHDNRPDNRPRDPNEPRSFNPHTDPVQAWEKDVRQREDWPRDDWPRDEGPRPFRGQPDDTPWPRPGLGPSGINDRHIDTYESRREPHSPYDEPDFQLNERGQYDEPGYQVDEPYEASDNWSLQSGWGNQPRGRPSDHAGYGPASENQPSYRDDHNAYRPAPWAPPPGAEGPGAEEQTGGVFGHTGPMSQTGRGPKRQKRRDDRICDEINERLTFDPHLDPRDVEVTVKNAEVTLEGEVASRRDKFHAEEIADAVSGVSDIHNKIKVKRPKMA